MEHEVAPLPPLKPKRYIYGPVVYVVPMRVTACSPQDPKDQEYYAKNGYAGDAYGIAADLRMYPKGTEMRVPGYMKDTWEEVDSSGGTVIRIDARRKGIEQIDVKFRTLYSTRKWGSQNLNVEVVLPAKASVAQRRRIESLATDSYPAWVKEVQ
jgi:3D (Asp-Asp-Asp) domain-containing protein